MSNVSTSYTPTFLKRLKKLPSSVRKKACKREKTFQNDPFAPALKTHKLSGKLKDYWSFSINYKYRIVFRFLSSQEVLFVDVGSHEVYR